MLIQLCGLPHVYFSISQRMHALNNLFILNSMFQHITLLHEKIFRILQFQCWTTHTKQLNVHGPKQARVDSLWSLSDNPKYKEDVMLYTRLRLLENSQILNRVHAARVKSHT